MPRILQELERTHARCCRRRREPVNAAARRVPLRRRAAPIHRPSEGVARPQPAPPSGARHAGARTWTRWTAARAVAPAPRLSRSFLGAGSRGPPGRCPPRACSRAWCCSLLEDARHSGSIGRASRPVLCAGGADSVMAERKKSRGFTQNVSRETSRAADGERRRRKWFHVNIARRYAAGTGVLLRKNVFT